MRVSSILQIPFTRITLCTAAIGYMFGVHSHTRAVSTCLLCGTALSFHVAPLLDRRVYARMARMNGWTMRQFHAGNVIVHALPAILGCLYPPTHMHILHGMMAVFVHGTWGWYTSGGTMCMDDVYAPMTPTSWFMLWIVAFSMEVAVACSL